VTPVRALYVLILVMALSGCEQAMQDMYDQPKSLPYDKSKLFEDGMSARHPPDGSVIARKGILAGTSSGRQGMAPGFSEVPPVLPRLKSYGDVSVSEPPGTLPAKPPVSAALLRRGKERFEIFCAPCHSVLGDGDGPVVRRGFPAPPSYHTDRLRQAPDSYFYQVITRGYGMMYPYASRVAPRDRWAIIAYIRALQLSQHAPVGQLPPEAKRKLNGGADG
jgi:hypothetical protein